MPFGDPPLCAECGKYHFPQCNPTPKLGWLCPQCGTIHNPSTMTCYRCEINAWASGDPDCTGDLSCSAKRHNYGCDRHPLLP